MVFDIYKIRNKELARYVQYVLFNYAATRVSRQVITSFANTNICLGIVKEQDLCERADGVKYMRRKSGIGSYLSGMYLRPHRFEAAGTLDEICIDFTPTGYYHFFRFPAKTYMLNEDILTEAFGSSSTAFFETVFATTDLQLRGAMIEHFLLQHILHPDNTFIRQCLHHIHSRKGWLTLRQLSGELRCSEKKIVRTFLASFDLTPKDYMRIVRFRQALSALNAGSHITLTQTGYQNNYFDQSHFIKDIRFFTDKTPGQIRQSLLDVKQNVIIGVE